MIAVVSRLWIMSLQAGILILIVLAVRFFLRKYPKIYSYCLWAIVGFRLLCPIWVELPDGVSAELPNFEIILNQIINTEENVSNVGAISQENNQTTQMQQSVQNAGNAQGGQFVQNTANTQNSGMGEQENGPKPENSSLVVDSVSTWTVVLPKVLTIIYLTGVAVLAVVYLIQYLLLKKRVSTAVLGKGNVWFSENIRTPFVMGVFRPQIYLPYGLDRVSGRYILKHERTHIKHHDPLIRMIGVLCLCLHWWNPLVWVAVYQMNQDMEMFCDEGFLLRAPIAEKKAYANALLAFAEKGNSLWVELAFGESHTEQRVRNILYHKKDGIVGIVVVMLVIILGGCTFLTESPEVNDSMDNINSGGDVVTEEDILNDEGDESVAGSENSEGREKVQAEEAQIYGIWTITDRIMPSGVYALSDEQIQAIIGTRLEYTEDSCRRSLTGTVESVNQYTVGVITGEQLEEDFGMSAEALGVAGMELQYYEVDWDSMDLFGQFFYQIDKDNALVYYEGVFFRAERAWYEISYNETANGESASQEFVLDEQGKAFLQNMCYYMPEWSGYASLDEEFWREFLFYSFTSPTMLEDGKAMTICGEAEVISVYREDLGFTESQVKISKEAVAEYVKLAMGVKPLQFEPAFEDMEPGQTAFYYENGYYYIGFSDFGSVGYTFKECEVHEELYTTYAFVRFDVYVDEPENVEDTIEFIIYPAENQNGFTIISKELLSNY